MIQCNSGGCRIAIAIIIAVDVVGEEVPSDRLSWVFVGRAGDQLVTGSFHMRQLNYLLAISEDCVALSLTD